MKTEGCDVMLLQAIYDVHDFFPEHLYESVCGTIFFRERFFLFVLADTFFFSGYPAILLLFFVRDDAKA